MNETKHTPGPWTWFGNVKTDTMYLGTTDRGRLIVLDGGEFRFPDRSLCIMREAFDYVTPDHNGEFTEVNHPNARLIAAAPDLLETCKRVLAWGEDQDRGDPYHGNPFDPYIIDVIEEAIAKAEGEDQ